MRKSIVLAADNAYLRQLETTIKSVLCHNREVDFYILNSDIAPEWFKLLGEKMEKLDSSIRNVHLEQGLFQDYKTGPHLNYASYFRFFSTEVVETDRVLYLDSDVLVTGDLTSLFETDLQGYFLGAVDDPYAYEGRSSGFNSGVLLMDVGKWKEHQVVDTLLELAANYNKEVHLGDQSILNIYFENNWLALDRTYNYMVGLDIYSLAEALPRLDRELPIIAHFASHDKPWNTYSVSRLRELWWVYHDLDWYEIVTGHAQLNYAERSGQSKKNALVVTWVLEVEHLERLVSSLSDWHFHIAAPVYCAPALTKLSVYSNVTLYQSIIHQRIDWLLEDADVYLDINHGDEVFGVVTRAKDKGKTIYAFETTQKYPESGWYDGIFSPQHPEELIETLQRYK